MARKCNYPSEFLTCLSVYLAAESVKAEKYDLSQAKKMSADCLWICLQTLSKNSFTEFYDQLLNSAQS